jgi:hypothetical protein
MIINKKVALKLAQKFNINLDVVNLEQWEYGLNVELEHNDITHHNKNITSKIVVAHLKEDPFYYYRLQKLEDDSKKYWKNKIKPDIFINNK